MNDSRLSHGMAADDVHILCGAVFIRKFFKHFNLVVLLCYYDNFFNLPFKVYLGFSFPNLLFSQFILNQRTHKLVRIKFVNCGF